LSEKLATGVWAAPTVAVVSLSLVSRTPVVTLYASFV
jgi:hypothetical protein